MSVYFIAEEGNSEIVKIGYAVSIDKRLAQLQGGNIRELQVMRVIKGDAQAEQWLHRRFAPLRIRGEWFHFDPEMMTVSVPTFKPTRREPSKGPTPEWVKQLAASIPADCERLGIYLPEHLRRCLSAGGEEA